MVRVCVRESFINIMKDPKLLPYPLLLALPLFGFPPSQTGIRTKL